MSSPVVAGTVALMLQANPSLTPNAVKAILQYTAEANSNLDRLTQGAGFLNASGAVALARYFAQPSAAYPVHGALEQTVDLGQPAGQRRPADARCKRLVDQRHLGRGHDEHRKRR